MENLTKRDLSVGMGVASLFGLLLGIGAVLPFGLMARLVHGRGAVSDGIDAMLSNFWIFLLIFALGIVIHELLHGLTWSWFGNVPHSKMKYGFIVWALTPYCHSTVPLKATAYRWGAFMPGLLLGFLPMALGVALDNSWLLGFGIIMTVAAGGDFTILWQLRHVSADALVEDHPSRAGCYVYE